MILNISIYCITTNELLKLILEGCSLDFPHVDSHLHVIKKGNIFTCKILFTALLSSPPNASTNIDITYSFTGIVYFQYHFTTTYFQHSIDVRHIKAPQERWFNYKYLWFSLIILYYLFIVNFWENALGDFSVSKFTETCLMHEIQLVLLLKNISSVIVESTLKISNKLMYTLVLLRFSTVLLTFVSFYYHVVK